MRAEKRATPLETALELSLNPQLILRQRECNQIKTIYLIKQFFVSTCFWVGFLDHSETRGT
ncbi:hypothetical protein BpHYR1_038762 [Brachionus plicatilis]|uniref:Uncharacterized protein n=1 Tax=Brachionus plicatilis TaxID=10195 RepID=A0A3M7QSP7_BRAPC|nr:hypothetical protein BpHYR1_038762 [Brachionus plicatilis]